MNRNLAAQQFSLMFYGEMSFEQEGVIAAASGRVRKLPG